MSLIRTVKFKIGGVIVKCPLKYFTPERGSRGTFVVQLPERVVAVVNANPIREGVICYDEGEALRAAKDAIQIYNEAVQTEVKVILFESSDARELNHTFGTHKAEWHGMKLRWRISTQFKKDNGEFEYLDEHDRRSGIYDESVIEWTQEREDFFILVCKQLDAIAERAGDFFSQDGAQKRIDSIIPKLAAGASLPLLGQ